MSLKTILALCLMVPLLSACPNNGSVIDNGKFFAPIYTSKDDKFTDGTARQILDHNETGKKIYKWKPAKG